MSVRRFTLLALSLLAGCAGQVRDYVGPRSEITAPHFARYGLNPNQARCMGERLAGSLTPRQLRMFARAAGALRQGERHPAALTFRDMVWVANTMGDAAVPAALARADAACGVSAADAYARELREAEERAARQAEAAAAAARAPRPSSWLNLGAAGSGQSIAVDAATIVREEGRRTAWFRLTDPGATAPNPDVYLLVIDCAARTINAKARERRAADGSIADRVDYPDNPLPVEGGTVMEIAFLSMCT
ncbi:MAG TPA: hypothetical protein VGW40_08005 [Allosphingosinicella sp.]|nr:hypothetical protein [Allosphingosinicella sp.]